MPGVPRELIEHSLNVDPKATPKRQHLRRFADDRRDAIKKTAFINLFGAYCYTTMSFGLKNTGATYQRAIQACFKRQLNKNVEAYVDDVVIKTRNSSMLIDDLEETFASLREYRSKLIPNKCVFGVPSCKLLGFIISHRGIEANPEKISAITSMKAPTCSKDI
jgi:hypothetical protein